MHPVPLAVQDVVADLHVLEDLGGAQARGAEDPGRREDAEEQHRAAAELERALGLDDLADVGRVAGAAGVDDVLADGVELDADRLDVLAGQVGDGADRLLLDDGHGDLLVCDGCSSGSVGSVVERSIRASGRSGTRRPAR